MTPRRSPLPAVAVLALAAIALSLAAAGPGLLPGDLALARTIQSAPIPGADALAHGLTWLGNAVPTVVVLTLAAIAILAATGRRAEAALIAAAAVLRATSPLLKGVVGSPRPTPDLVRVVERADGLGFPNGHALGALLFYGVLWLIAPAVVPNRPTCQAVRGIAVALILLTGLARVRTGAHWPSDVLGGFLWGGLLLSLLAILYARRRRRS